MSTGDVIKKQFKGSQNVNRGGNQKLVEGK